MNLKNLLENGIFETENVKREHKNETKKPPNKIEELQLEMEALKVFIKKRDSHYQKQPPFPWMDMAETMQTLKIAERTVHSYIEKGILGRSWLGDKLYFNRKEIEKLLVQNYEKKGISK